MKAHTITSLPFNFAIIASWMSLFPSLANGQELRVKPLDIGVNYPLDIVGVDILISGTQYSIRGTAHSLGGYAGLNIEFPYSEYSLVFGGETGIDLYLARPQDCTQYLNSALYTNGRVGIAVESVHFYAGYGHLANIVNEIQYDSYPGFVGLDLNFTGNLIGSIRWYHVDVADKISVSMRLSF